VIFSAYWYHLLLPHSYLHAALLVIIAQVSTIVCMPVLGQHVVHNTHTYSKWTPHSHAVVYLVNICMLSVALCRGTVVVAGASAVCSARRCPCSRCVTLTVVNDLNRLWSNPGLALVNSLLGYVM
jgi:hypothetical protein